MESTARMARLKREGQSGTPVWTRRRWLSAAPAAPGAAALRKLGFGSGLGLGMQAHSGTVGPDRLQEITAADRSWVQVAVAPDGRCFVNFSRWFGPLPVAVAQIHSDGRLLPYPDLAFSSGDASRDPRTHARA